MSVLVYDAIHYTHPMQLYEWSLALSTVWLSRNLLKLRKTRSTNRDAWTTSESFRSATTCIMMKVLPVSDLCVCDASHLHVSTNFYKSSPFFSPLSDSFRLLSVNDAHSGNETQNGIQRVSLHPASTDASTI